MKSNTLLCLTLCAAGCSAPNHNTAATPAPPTSSPTADAPSPTPTSNLTWSPYQAPDGTFSASFPFAVKAKSAKSMAMKGVVFSSYEARDAASGQQYVVHLTTYGDEKLAKKMLINPEEMLKTTIPDSADLKFMPTPPTTEPTIRFSGELEGKPIIGMATVTDQGHHVFTLWGGGGPQSDAKQFLDGFKKGH